MALQLSPDLPPTSSLLSSTSPLPVSPNIYLSRHRSLFCLLSAPAHHCLAPRTVPLPHALLFLSLCPKAQSLRATRSRFPAPVCTAPPPAVPSPRLPLAASSFKIQLWCHLIEDPFSWPTAGWIEGLSKPLKFHGFFLYKTDHPQF